MVEGAALALLSAISTNCFAPVMAVSYAVLSVSLAVVMNVVHAATAVSVPFGAFFARLSTKVSAARC